MIAMAFYRCRVLPLMECCLRFDEMTPGASLEGSRILPKTLSLVEIVLCVSLIMGNFTEANIGAVPMRPTEGFIEL